METTLPVIASECDAIHLVDVGEKAETVQLSSSSGKVWIASLSLAMTAGAPALTSRGASIGPVARFPAAEPRARARRGG